jgi:hypothetical protein
MTAPNLTPVEKDLLAYYERDARGQGHKDPYAGLPLTRVRVIRETLHRKGLLERVGGRWRIPLPDLELEIEEQEAA